MSNRKWEVIKIELVRSVDDLKASRGIATNGMVSSMCGLIFVTINLCRDQDLIPENEWPKWEELTKIVGAGMSIFGMQPRNEVTTTKRWTADSTDNSLGVSQNTINEIFAAAKRGANQ